MKVIYFAPTSTLYGDNIALLNILSVLVPSKRVIPLVITVAEGEFTEKLRELGYDYIVYPTDSNFWPSSNTWKGVLMFLPRLLRHNICRKICTTYLLHRVKSFSPEIIHSNNSCFGLGVIVANKMKVAHIQHIREYGRLDMGKIYFPSEKSFVHRISTLKSNEVICVSKGIKNYFNTFSDTSKWNCVYDGVFNGEPVFEKSKDSYFLYVGRLFEGKNVGSLIHQFAEYCKRNDNGVILKLAGDGDTSYREELKSLVKSHSISDRVIFLGYRSDVNVLMQKALALFVPSNFEGFGFITAEAMFNGCLVVGRNTGGTKEQFDNGLEYTGKEIGIRYNEDSELVSIMESVVCNGPEHYCPMIKRSQQLVAKLYSIDTSANQVFDLYEKVVSQKS